mmetsp:Transcript_24571/g.69131  ORF Transcript_24571/g.69131 Transcript_24571/m.69131 type:complete len:227 (-) Transcript_24571:415-1095(-)
MRRAADALLLLRRAALDPERRQVVDRGQRRPRPQHEAVRRDVPLQQILEHVGPRVVLLEQLPNPEGRGRVDRRQVRRGPPFRVLRRLRECEDPVRPLLPLRPLLFPRLRDGLRRQRRGQRRRGDGAGAGQARLVHKGRHRRRGRRDPDHLALLPVELHEIGAPSDHPHAHEAQLLLRRAGDETQSVSGHIRRFHQVLEPHRSYAALLVEDDARPGDRARPGGVQRR